MFLWLLILISNGTQLDSTAIDTIKTEKYEIPLIVDFTQTGRLDSVLNQERVLEPILLFKGFAEFVNFAPYLIRDRGYAIDLLSPYPIAVDLHSHSLKNYFLDNFNFVSLPVNFMRPVGLSRGATENGICALNIATKINVYNEPHSSLYFTMFGGSKYSIDFTRAITNSTGFYLNGLYSRQYKNSDKVYLRTNTGYANLYFNKFIPSRIDLIFSENNYDTLFNISFHDISLTMGNELYKLAIFQMTNTTEQTNPIDSSKAKNEWITYGAIQRLILEWRNFENIFGLDIAENKFRYSLDGPLSKKQLEFYHSVNFYFHRLIAGLGYRIDYETDRQVYLNPITRLKYDILNGLSIFGELDLFHRRANFLEHYGNGHQIDRMINLIGNPDIKDEKYLHKEIGMEFKEVVFSLYHSAITNQIVYQPESSNSFSVVNIDNHTISGFEGFFEVPIWKNLSLAGAFNYLSKPEIPETFPRTNLKFCLNWKRKTERSNIYFFTRLNFMTERIDITDNHYPQFWTISPGLSIKFITLNLGMLFENILDENPGDFPNMGRNFSLEINWEFWD